MHDPDGDTIRLSDGRKLGYRVLGDPTGVALFFFHGTPGSRFALTVNDPIANVSGLKIILPERPGFGESSPKKNRTISDWPADVEELADTLSIRNFHVSGSSGGGPYAIACGVAMPERVQSVLLFNTTAPMELSNSKENMAFANRFGAWTAKYAPWILKMAIKSSAKSLLSSPEKFVDALRKQLCRSDMEILSDSNYEAAVIRDLQAAVRHETHGHYSDSMLMMRPWNVDFTKLKSDVFLWHGEEDTLAPIQNVKHLVSQIPSCNATYIPEAGHLLIDNPIVVDAVVSLLVNKSH